MEIRDKLLINFFLQHIFIYWYTNGTFFLSFLLWFCCLCYSLIKTLIMVWIKHMIYFDKPFKHGFFFGIKILKISCSILIPKFCCIKLIDNVKNTRAKLCPIFFKYLLKPCIHCIIERIIESIIFVLLPYSPNEVYHGHQISVLLCCQTYTIFTVSYNIHRQKINFFPFCLRN